ncbi:DNA polymerase III subunit delta' [Goodfellowiella coeruleoviolacea]|uniref:DNA polymerase-3 subunit delta n=1 Tax=Goodfellowiella coeruleoviolacea TaxID=334858 RepID=A0AAE3GAD9_9PSEU|nr:DNA polymerase III subunit delta' [Goodfellowiella coeruleoviolacea]MCP2164641.1 DNA polymerase-3 subunit delta' [Goodfellowiella coeruleoviolacea]
MSHGGVWAEVVGQDDAVRVLSAAAEAAADVVAGRPTAPGAMTHAWLFTGPPGSGRTEVARSFAAALQCAAVDDRPGCGVCTGCRTTLAGTHADVRFVAPEGLSISVAEMRALVQAAARRPTTGRWQVVVIEEADRLTEGAANALLKAVEEPPPRTVFLLCAPSDHPDDVSVTIRSRCRLVALRTPPAAAIAQHLAGHDGIDQRTAEWAASICGGHVGRARRLATDEAARQRREAVLRIPLALRRPADVFTCADKLISAAETEASTVNDARDEAERQALETAMGAGGTGKGTAAATRGAKGALKDLERRQKSRSTRTQRDTLDLALVDLAAFYRDVLVTTTGAEVSLNHPDRASDVATAAASWTPESTLRRLEAVLACRRALERNVKPRIAVEAMVTALHHG